MEMTNYKYVMKKKLFTLISVIPLLFLLAGCGKEDPETGTGTGTGTTEDNTPKESFEVSFPDFLDAGSTRSVRLEGSATVSVRAVRNKRIDEQTTVPVVLEDASGLFSLTPLVFAAGASESSFDITYSGLSAGKTYTVTVSIEDEGYIGMYQTNTRATYEILWVEKMYAWPYPVKFKFWFFDGTDQAFYDSAYLLANIEYYVKDGVRYCSSANEVYTGSYNGQDMSYSGHFWKYEPPYSSEHLTFKWYTELDYKGFQPLEVSYQAANWFTWDNEEYFIVYAMDHYTYYSRFQNQKDTFGATFTDYINNYEDMEHHAPCYFSNENGGTFMFNLIYYMPKYGTDGAAYTQGYEYDMVGVSQL